MNLKPVALLACALALPAAATGMLGTDFVAKAAPDGHTLALVASSHAINPSMFKKLPFDTVKSFEPVALTHVVPLMRVLSPTVPAKTLPEIIAYGRANPGKLSFASGGSGGAPHMSRELFKSMTGIDMLHGPYKGSTAARALAVTTPKRSSVFPDLPTMNEAGLKGYETSTWGGLLAPAGIEPGGGTPAVFAAFIQAEMARWAKVAKDAGIQPE